MENEAQSTPAATPAATPQTKKRVLSVRPTIEEAKSSLRSLIARQPTDNDQLGVAEVLSVAFAKRAANAIEGVAAGISDGAADLDDRMAVATRYVALSAEANAVRFELFEASMQKRVSSLGNLGKAADTASGPQTPAVASPAPVAEPTPEAVAPAPVPVPSETPVAQA